MNWLIITASVWSIGLGGGVTNPHSDCDGNTCLDPGPTAYVSVERTNRFTDNLSLRYGVTLSYMDFTKADRETSSSPRHNRRSDSDLIFSAQVKPQLTLFHRYTLFPVVGLGTDTSSEVYTELGAGVDVRLYKGLHLQVETAGMKAKCTWHRTSTIGVRYEF